MIYFLVNKRLNFYPSHYDFRVRTHTHTHMYTQIHVISLKYLKYLKRKIIKKNRKKIDNKKIQN